MLFFLSALSLPFHVDIEITIHLAYFFMDTNKESIDLLMELFVSNIYFFLHQKGRSKFCFSRLLNDNAMSVYVDFIF